MKPLGEKPEVASSVMPRRGETTELEESRGVSVG